MDNNGDINNETSSMVSPQVKIQSSFKSTIPRTEMSVSKNYWVNLGESSTFSKLQKEFLFLTSDAMRH